ncbi:MAG: 50S ribosomal protein L22 [Candidatus Nomurabacteria bacterium GW2011_GWF2_35_66]|uniref:Large ribosomal subunit protein uL22 n=1 Tax=Candidatus Nomurabacteria bacterium GW2011_GWE1_35_16 TaxID=1618761 RepID=A0A0G0DS78_9BACT|nr:MAG: 50S ribosomal protein L22 [Candidatus Nomurabacteria bacterium GW2011_GWF1_34_20]KKP61611.1 MAG: 50S ribosomal protein L22 [Candidatus Nomurabacteria bacterium GW2011_GWE2_34_25]KKP65905.1 MAG: 50S ribosomal protein L22 [Candidatus Nomurabacteria bacterium GW2011_GWE1_35_16]KKP82961.1 MAG: 50S ribosomal protein L22 [Candidatus Nomurabacteria bacterium GW2011_GWF2_35_66]HAE36274.1 50S ribosomal protein L22 [Candidatus Nomurabacteria bacterium]
MKAFLKNYRQSPRKVRLVADLIKGNRVAQAFTQLKALPRRASGPMEQLLASAVANAKSAGISDTDLYVENVTVNKGIVMKRSMPRARGSASRINKRTSHIMLTLIEKNTEKKIKTEKVTKKEVKKVAKQSKPAKETEVKE